MSLTTPAVHAAAALLGAGLAIAGGVLAVSGYSALTVIRPRRSWRPDGWTGPPAGVEAVTFSAPGGPRLAGWLAPPTDGRAVAIVLHGFGTNRTEGQDLLPALRAAGCGALLFDFRAHGESEGRFTTIGAREVPDVLAAVAYLQQRFGAHVPIFVVGFSMGAALGILAAARCPAIRAVVADSPFATLERAIGRSFELFFHLPAWLFAPPTLWIAERVTGERIGNVRPIDAVASIAPRPLLLVRSGEDVIVDPEDCNLLYAAAAEPKELWTVPGAGHVQARALVPAEYTRRLHSYLELAALGRAAARAGQVAAGDVDGRPDQHDSGRSAVGGPDDLGDRTRACGPRCGVDLDRGPDAVDGELLVPDQLGAGQPAAADLEQE